MMNLNAVNNALLGETVYTGTHSSGLRVYVYHKPEFSSSFAMFGTVYGSVDNRFKTRGQAEFTEVPEGVAHFLEHKLFENEDGDVFSLFAKTGASANAYTSFDRTCYLFSCTDNFDINMETLLDFVQSPYFTAETVGKEQGIIGQEIDMYRDNAGWRVFFNLLAALYERHPVRIDIAGTKNSIAKITPELLYECHSAFYKLSNMFITVAGNIEPEHVAELIDLGLKQAKPAEVIRDMPIEGTSVFKDRTEQHLPVAQPMFALGFKEMCTEPQKSGRHRAAMRILLNLLAGQTSDLYLSLLNDGLINDNFSTEYFTAYGCAAPIFSGESRDPDTVKARILAEIERAKREGFNRDLFENAKKAMYGQTVSVYNNPDDIASMLTECMVMHEGPFDAADVIGSLTMEDIDSALNAIAPENCSLSLILP